MERVLADRETHQIRSIFLSAREMYFSQLMGYSKKGPQLGTNLLHGADKEELIKLRPFKDTV